MAGEPTGAQELLIGLAIQEAPALIERLKELFRKASPDAPEPSNEEVIAAYEGAFQSSLAKDDRWNATHPSSPGEGGQGG